MSATPTVRQDTFLPSGDRMISGILTLSTTYLTGGLTANLSTYLKSTDTPTVIVNPDDGYVGVRHDRGTAAAGKILVYYHGAAATTLSALTQVPSATNTSGVICQFIAIGESA